MTVAVPASPSMAWITTVSVLDVRSENVLDGVLTDPVRATTRLMQHAAFTQCVQQRINGPKSPHGSPSSNGISNAAHWIWLTMMRRLSGLISVFRVRPKKVARMAANVLIERAVAGNHHDCRLFHTPSGSPCLLPDRGNRTGITGQYRRIELTNVYAHLSALVATTPCKLPSRSPASIARRSLGK